MTTFLLVIQMNYCNQKFAGAIKFVVTSCVPPKGETTPMSEIYGLNYHLTEKSS